MKPRPPVLDRPVTRRRPTTEQEAALFRRAAKGEKLPPDDLPPREEVIILLPERVRPAAKAAPAPEPLDRRTKSRIRSGIMDIEATLDLHGMTQEAAHNALVAFLKQARQKKLYVVLVITGKGKAPSGVLRAALPGWLEDKPLRPWIVGFSPAAARHGGEGAWYLRLRRKGGVDA